VTLGDVLPLPRVQDVVIPEPQKNGEVAVGVGENHVRGDTEKPSLLCFDLFLIHSYPSLSCPGSDLHPVVPTAGIPGNIGTAPTVRMNPMCPSSQTHPTRTAGRIPISRSAPRSSTVRPAGPEEPVRRLEDRDSPPLQPAEHGSGAPKGEVPSHILYHNREPHREVHDRRDRNRSYRGKYPPRSSADDGKKRNVPDLARADIVTRKPYGFLVR